MTENLPEMGAVPSGTTLSVTDEGGGGRKGGGGGGGGAGAGGGGKSRIRPSKKQSSASTSLIGTNSVAAGHSGVSANTPYETEDDAYDQGVPSAVPSFSAYTTGSSSKRGAAATWDDRIRMNSHSSGTAMDGNVAAAAADTAAAAGSAADACSGSAAALYHEGLEDDYAANALNGDVPIWQRAAQQQPLVGRKESLAALLRDFRGSELQYAKARTFLVRLRGKHQQQQRQQQRQQQQQESCESGGTSSSSVSPSSRAAENGSSDRSSSSSSSGSGGIGKSSSVSPPSDIKHSTPHNGDCTENPNGKDSSSSSSSSSSSAGISRAGRSIGNSQNGGGKGRAEGSRCRENDRKEMGERSDREDEEEEDDEILQEVQGGPCLRRVRGDGCCFYRGYMFGLLLYFLKHRDKIKDFIRKINEEFRPEIRKVGYDMDTVADFSQEMINSLEQVEAASAKDPTSEKVLEEIFNEVSSSNYIVVFARLLVSTHMKLNSEMYLPFLTSYATVEEFCKHEVDPMWVAAEELQINALTAMTQVPVEIIYFDRSPGVNPTHHVFPESQEPQIHLLYRPGHYDILST